MYIVACHLPRGSNVRWREDIGGGLKARRYAQMAVGVVRLCAGEMVFAGDPFSLAHDNSIAAEPCGWSFGDVHTQQMP